MDGGDADHAVQDEVSQEGDEVGPVLIQTDLEGEGGGSTRTSQLRWQNSVGALVVLSC